MKYKSLLPPLQVFFIETHNVSDSSADSEAMDLASLAGCNRHLFILLDEFEI